MRGSTASPQAKSDKKPSITTASSPAEAGDNVSPLLACFTHILKLYDNEKSPSSLLHGVEYNGVTFTLANLVEVAEKNAFTIKSYQHHFTEINNINLPAILILKNGGACVLLKNNGKKHHIFSPQKNAEITVDTKSLDDDFDGTIFYLQPIIQAERLDVIRDKTDNDKNWLWSCVMASKGLVLKTLVASALINIFALASPLFIMNVYDRVLPNSAFETGWVLAIGALCVFIFDFLLRNLRGYFVDLSARKTDLKLSKKIYDHLLDIKILQKRGTSGAFANMIRDFESIKEFITSSSITAFVDLPFTIIFLGFIAYLGGLPIALLLLSLMALACLAGFVLQAPLKKIVKNMSPVSQARHGLLVETINTLETIKTIGNDGVFRNRYSHYTGKNAIENQKIKFLSSLAVNFSMFIQQTVGIFIILLGMYRVEDHLMSVGALIACVILSGRAIAPISQIAQMVVKYHQMKDALKSLDHFMKLPVERPQTVNFLSRPDIRGRITFKNVGFKYPEQTGYAVNNISFDIAEGEKVGIIGRAGSGKSTLTKLMMGLYEPVDGNILIDNTDISQIDPADIRRKVGYVAQDSNLFQGTIKDNIRAGKIFSNDRDIINAATLSGAHDFIQKNPSGYDFHLGERGEGLSGGQKQCLVWARTLIADPSVIICDEPTNAMDSIAEAHFMKTVRENLKDKTFILVTHKTPLLALVDRLILIENGEIVAQGPRDKVLKLLAGHKTDA